jgi:hypothetical protein
MKPSGLLPKTLCGWNVPAAARWIATAGCGLLLTTLSVSAQDASSEAQSAAPAGRQSVVVSRGSRTQTWDERQMVAQAGEYADRLIEEGRDSFDRGLMRLSDYSEHLSIALQLKTTLADMRQDDRAKIAALSERASLLETAAAQLREFNEPASQGWAAETAQAQLLAAEARGELAQARQDRIDLAQAERRRSELAIEHFEHRRTDLD